ncbi:MAG: flagellar biosynthesis protein FlhF, partial [Pseudomonadales bacterium]|nr:flagellar biosynthesis protein FlhF [Pseudomonadales bacterium]
RQRQMCIRDRHSAMKLVKEDMGPDAVILSHRNVMEGVEIVAAPADMLEPLQQAQQQVTQTLAQASAVANGSTVANANAKAAARTPIAAQKTSPPSEERARSFSFSGLSKRSGTSKEKPEQINRGIANDVTVSLSSAITQPGVGKLPGSVQGTLPRGDQLQTAGLLPPAKRSKTPGSVSRQPTATDHAYEQMIKKNNMELSAVKDELSGLKALLEAQFKALSWTQFSQQTPIHAAIWKRLEAAGLQASLCDELVSGLSTDDGLKQGWNNVSEHLKQMLPIFFDDLCDYEGIVSLVGPTGAGKTTTIGKIAAHHVLKYGASEVALVTTDSYRIASRDQLNSYGRILGIPVYSVTEQQPLDQVLENVSKRRLVLIDNPGLSGDEALFGEHLDQLARSHFPIDHFFVMPCTSQYQVLESYLQRLNLIQLHGCIVSKTDEASEIGHLLSLAIERELPIASYTDGQNIPDDIHRAESHQLVIMAGDISKPKEKSPQMDDQERFNDGHKQEKTPRMDLNDY